MHGSAFEHGAKSNFINALVELKDEDEDDDDDDDLTGSSEETEEEEGAEKEKSHHVMSLPLLTRHAQLSQSWSNLISVLCCNKKT